MYLVTTGCGSSSSENCTYFEVSGANDGPCVGKICKCSSNICQVRFSKYSYVISFGNLINSFLDSLGSNYFCHHRALYPDWYCWQNDWRSSNRWCYNWQIIQLCWKLLHWFIYSIWICRCTTLMWDIKWRTWYLCITISRYLLISNPAD